MSNNVKTAEQWKQVAAEDQARLEKNLAEQAVVVAEFERLKIARAEAKAQLDQAVAATGNALSPEAKALRTEYNKLNSQFNQEQTRVRQYNEIIEANRSNIVFANNQAEKAASGPPNDNSVTQPASANPGSNTAVPPDAPPPTVAEQQTVSSEPTSGSQGTVIPNAQATTISTENGIVTKTQEFPGTTVPPQDETQTTQTQTTPSPPVADSSTTINYQGPARDDDGNLQPGWIQEPESGREVFVGGNYVDPTTRASAAESRRIAQQPKPAFDPPKDWRVRISLAKSAQYFYNLDDKDAGILAPLKGTGGVVFPYMPTIQVSYSAQYDTLSPTHSNYKIHNYQSSSVDNVTVSGDFTAQDVNEANYMLAVIHFFRTAAKMFYGQDQNPARGVPPPLLYLTGLGQYQFDNHPMVLTNFSYTLPQDVDYVNAYPNGAANAGNGVDLAAYNKPNTAKPSLLASGIQRLLGSGLKPGGTSVPKVTMFRPTGNSQVTRVPTKINISLTFLPIITRNAMSNKFSLKDYASGKLLRGSQNGGTGGGMW